MTVNRGLNCDGTATRYAGFNMLVTEQVATDGAAFVAAAKAGNLCSNVHTSAFPGGEIRGQLSVVSDSGTGHNRVIELAGPLDASQEPGPTSDSTATGEGSDTVTINEHGAVVCSSSLSVVGLNEADLQSLVRGRMSAIHLHKAPAGQNSPIVQDTLVDAGSMLDPLHPASMSSARVVTRWPNSDRRTSPLDRMKRSVPSSYSNLRIWFERPDCGTLRCSAAPLKLPSFATARTHTRSRRFVWMVRRGCQRKAMRVSAQGEA